MCLETVKLGSYAQLSKVRNFRVGDYLVEPPALRVIGDGQVVRLEPRALQVLVYLAAHVGCVISRVELEENIWEGRN